MAGYSSARAASSGPRRPVTRTVARWAEFSGSGKRSTVARSPAWASATTRWSNAAPQLISRSRPSGSVAESCLFPSAYRSTTPSAGSMRHRHGWVLCTEGARRACSTASSSCGVRLIVRSSLLEGHRERGPWREQHGAGCVAYGGRCDQPDPAASSHTWTAEHQQVGVQELADDLVGPRPYQPERSEE